MSRFDRFCLTAWELVQRALGVALVTPALLIVAPFALVIRLHSRGPVLFRQTREGRKGGTFRMLKLRTMLVDADAALSRHLAASEAARREWEEYGRLSEDPRLAGPAARLARRLSIDELPQLLNVACGDMVLVGPRPLPIEVLPQLSPEDRWQRQSVPPGITGLWQVSGRSSLTLAAAGRLDSIYVKGRTVAGDLVILLRTVPAVLGGRGAY